MCSESKRYQQRRTPSSRWLTPKRQREKVPTSRSSHGKAATYPTMVVCTPISPSLCMALPSICCLFWAKSQPTSPPPPSLPPRRPLPKEWFGVGKPPADAQWLELTRRDPEAGTVERMGTDSSEDFSPLYLTSERACAHIFPRCCRHPRGTTFGGMFAHYISRNKQERADKRPVNPPYERRIPSHLSHPTHTSTCSSLSICLSIGMLVCAHARRPSARSIWFHTKSTPSTLPASHNSILVPILARFDAHSAVCRLFTVFHAACVSCFI